MLHDMNRAKSIRSVYYLAQGGTVGWSARAAMWVEDMRSARFRSRSGDGKGGGLVEARLAESRVVSAGESWAVSVRRETACHASIARRNASESIRCFWICLSSR